MLERSASQIDSLTPGVESQVQDLVLNKGSEQDSLLTTLLLIVIEPACTHLCIHYFVSLSPEA